MNKYNYTVKFKIKNNNNYLYNTSFQIETNSNKDAKVIGNSRWEKFKQSHERLVNATVIKVICRKIETKPRVRMRKMPSLEKALSVLNNYICREN